MLEYSILALVVLLGGWAVAIPFMTLGAFPAVYLLSCFVVFLLLQNWSLAHDKPEGEMSLKKQALVKQNEVLTSRNLAYRGLSLALMHWTLLAHKALALNEIGKITRRKRTLSRSQSCDSKK